MDQETKQKLKDLLTSSAQIGRIKSLLEIRKDYISQQMTALVHDKNKDLEDELQRRIFHCDLQITKLMETFPDQVQEHLRNTYFN